MNIDEKAVHASTDDQVLSDFISDQKSFIINCAYKATNKYISQSDDEWSVSLIAFSNAVKTYDIKKGHFLSYAKILISNSLTDYYRTNKKYNNEISIDPYYFQSNPEPEEKLLNTKLELSKKLSLQAESNINHEIEAANSEFNKFGFSFYDLAKCSPKIKRTKNICKKAILYVLNEPEIINELYSSRLLPIKKIHNNTRIPRKILEFYRRYIIATIEILSGEYPLLAEYFSFIGKGEKK